VRAGLDLHGDFSQMQVHRFGVAPRQDQGRAFAIFETNHAEVIGTISKQECASANNAGTYPK
jgi:hypothetical protein